MRSRKMLPFVKVPAESYRLAMALFTIPLMLAIWMLMAGSARLFSVLFGRGRVSFDGYLNLFGFSFCVTGEEGVLEPGEEDRARASKSLGKPRRHLGLRERFL